ncbi:TonB-dependent receptor plug domain-containing protein [Sphingobacterium sp. lm-10]|uniref:TonB-dependent receptor n=1 Tax=Sphingobacterium sp. lm-10 TaxID=2944904 RepID=UPI00201FF596|nr:TonB-dependent receptor [Sphingobacterium sp. lm-10]MCL7986842.1 TonB-dependent receptor plug domain-containing protein [Sphingobacterium sp. lm-10]
MFGLKWRLCLLLLVAVGATYGQGNVINGFIKTNNNQGLEGVTIRVLNDKSKQTHSDALGKYTLKNFAPGDYTIETYLMGYKTQQKTIRIVANEISKLNFTLEESDENIEQVQVQGKSKAQEIMQSGFNVNVIETKQYANSNTDINQILNRSTGVKIREQGGLGSNYSFSINGMSGNHIKFFIDGVPIEAYGSGMSFNNIPVNIVERIEVYKGVIPAHLTSDALGGAVNIITKRDRRKAIDVSYSYGSFNTHRAALSGSFTDPKKGLHVNVNSFFNYSDNDYRMYTNPKARVFLDVVNRDNPNTFDTIASAKRFHDAYRSNMTQVEAGLSGKRWADVFVLGMTYNTVYNEVQTGATQQKVYGHVQETSQSIVPSLRYRKENLFTSGLSATIFANFANDKSIVTDTSSYRVYRWDGRPDTYFPEAGEINLSKSIQHFNGYNSLLQSTFNYKINSVQNINLTHSFTNNYRKSYNEIDPYNHSFRQNNSVSRQILGLNYMHDFFDKKWRNQIFTKYYNFGGRVENADGGDTRQSKNYLGYGAASSYFLSNGLGIKASYEHAYRLPTMVELFGNGVDIYPNVGLVPESSDNYNLGVFYNGVLREKHRLYMTAAIFYRNAENYIHRTPPGVVSGSSENFSQYYNFGGIKVEGAEMEVTYSYGDLLKFTVNGSYESAVDREKYVRGTNRIKVTYDNRLPDKPWLYGNTDFIIGKNDLFGEGTRLEFNWFMQYVNEYSTTWSKLGDRTTNYYIPTQLIQNAGITYSIRHGLYNFTLEGRNLANQIAYDNSKLQKPGRFVSMKFRYNLNIY